MIRPPTEPRRHWRSTIPGSWRRLPWQPSWRFTRRVTRWFPGPKHGGRARAGLGALLLCAAAALVATGRGAAPTELELTDGGVWLATASTGTLTHLSGPAGLADAAVTVPGAVGRDLTVARAGSAVLVADPGSGQVHLVDPARLAAVRSADLGPGVTIVSSPAAAYAVDPRSGQVRRLARDDLAGAGSVLELPPPLGRAALTDDGTLWVPVRSAGTVVALRGGAAAPPRPVAPPGNAVDVVLAGGRPLAVDSTAATVTILGTGRVIALPPAGPPTGPAGGPRPDLLAPPRTDGGPVPLLDPATRRLFLVDVDHDADPGPGQRADQGTGAGTGPGTGQGSVTTVTIPTIPGSGQLGAPVVHSGHGYVPDSALGVVLDYDIARGGFADPVPVAVPAGHPRLTVTVDGDQVWINDLAGPDAVLIDARGRTAIAKQPPDLAGLATEAARPLPPAPPLPTGRRPAASRPAGTAGDPGPITPTAPTAGPAQPGTAAPRTTSTGLPTPPGRTTPEPTTAPPPSPPPTGPPPRTTPPDGTPPLPSPTVAPRPTSTPLGVDVG
ncbi:hypothetical protein [Parafrankia discariae]|uniref:hypothetical protein n=1 Tax=Parafrankia discariae TaxID=365528 RepID=UPI0003808EBE|nr:hypothetical protein [Parafrankia discariae]